MHKLMDQLITEMVERGVHYTDAQREFDRRFVSCVISTCDGNLCRAAAILGVHRNTLSRKVKAMKIKARTPAA